MLSSSQITFPEYPPELFPAVRFLKLALKPGLEPLVLLCVLMHPTRPPVAGSAQVNGHAVLLACLAIGAGENMMLLYVAEGTAQVAFPHSSFHSPDFSGIGIQQGKYFGVKKEG